jgi:outer membrane receptor protein involved in Fe transport
MKYRTIHPHHQLHLAAVAALSLCSMAALAQTAPAPAVAPANAAEAPGVEQVVVTATKREAVLTDVSLGISAVSQRALEARGVTTLEELGTGALGMSVIKAGPGENLLVSRGISTSQSLSIQSGPAVGVYVDEMPLTGITSGVPDFGLWDVARVELLRGPQGTLYGEGAMAGTIRIISNAPDSRRRTSRFQLSASSIADGGLGSGARAMVNVPLAEGVAALRATVGYNKDAGWIDAPDLHRKDVNTGKQTEARVAVRLTPSAALKVDASVWYQDASSVANGNQTSPGVYSPPALGIGAFANARLNSDGRDNTMANLTIHYDLGSFSLVSATSTSRQKLDSAFDVTDTAPFFFGPAAVGATALTSRARSVRMASQEVRLVSNGDERINWSVGAYLKNLDRHVDNTWDIIVPAFGLNDHSLVISDTSSKSKAVFGEADWRLGDAVTLTGGLRHYADDRAATANVVNFSQVFQVPVGISGPVATSEKQTTYNAIVSWKPSPRLNYFARAASGFRSGGPNFWAQDPAHIPKDFKAEKIQSLEAGVKTNPMPWLVFNAYAYRNQWRDKQVNLSTPSGQFDYVSNASAATSRGAEFELQADPGAGLTLAAAASYTDARLSADVLSSTGTVIAKSGNRLPYVARWEFKASVEYRRPVAAGLTGMANLSLAHRTANYSEITNAAATQNGSFNLANLRAGVEAGKSWGVYAYVKNLSNSHSTTTIQQSVAGITRYPNFIQPRTVGIELQASY